MTSKDELNKISKARLFVGSGVEGIVDSACKTYLDSYGQYRIDYNDIRDDDSVSVVTMNHSSSRNEDQIAESLFSKNKSVKCDKIIGYYHDLYVGHVVGGGYRKRASSGGFVSWLAVEMLKSGEIDGFIHVKKSDSSDVIFEYGISRTIKDIQSGAKSRYYPAELSKVLNEVKKKPGKYAVVGIPEIITELRLLSKKDRVIKNRIKYYFGLVCGHQKTTKYAEAIAWEYGIKPGNLKDIDFRVKKSTGTAIQYDMKFTGLVDNSIRTFTVRNVEPFVSSWAHGFFKARFSDFTDNSFNELADVTFGDAWLSEYVDDPKGTNILIVRNPLINRIIKKAIKGKTVRLDNVDAETIIRSQSGLVHHTKDELPYRLYKEQRDSGWAPVKRVEPNNSLDIQRQKVQDARQKIAENSHIYYKQAVEKDDFEWFKSRMKPYVDEYDRLYGKYIDKQKTLRKLVDYSKRKKELNADGAIVTLTGYFNYGNILQRYALQKFLKNNGYNFISYVNNHQDNYSDFWVGRGAKIKTPLRFIKRFMNYEKPYWFVPSIKDVYPHMYKNANLIDFVNRNIWIKSYNPNDKYDTYIVGSDQTWRNWWNNREILGYYFFNFLRGRKAKRISYAASFGNDDIEDVMSEEDVEYVRPYLEMFDSISVREKSGIKLIKDTWGIDKVKNVIDPTLLLDASEYSNLIEKTDVKYKKISPIFTYILGETDEIRNLVRKIQDNKKQAVTKMRAHGGAENDVLPPVEMWLKGFRDADLVVTNSFHGMMFSVINNTDFIIIGRKAGGLSRINDFLNMVGIEGRFVDESDMSDFDIKSLKPIDWDSVNNRINILQKQSGEWLINSIS